MIMGKTSLVGPLEGTEEGLEDGADEGRDEGLTEGRREGWALGSTEGRDDGSDEGSDEGVSEGVSEGMEDGTEDGTVEGVSEGVSEGFEVGALRLAWSFFASFLECLSSFTAAALFFPTLEDTFFWFLNEGLSAASWSPSRGTSSECSLGHWDPKAKPTDWNATQSEKRTVHCFIVTVGRLVLLTWKYDVGLVLPRSL
jgi:hypothetical protein